jgi:hypothetical protein
VSVVELNREKLQTLLRSLASDSDEAGRKYEVLRKKLVTKFHGPRFGGDR